MQSYAPPPRRSSAGKIIALVLTFGFLFFGMLAVAGVGFALLARSESQHARVVMERERAMQQVQRARAAELQARRAAENAQSFSELQETLVRELPVEEAFAQPRRNEPIRVANREITLQLDAEGNIQMDDQPVAAKQLKTLLRNASKGRESALSVLVKADKKCLFENVAMVLEVCQELDVPNVRITQLD